MYLEHFGLREAPFRITPHADFFFGGANRSALLDALVYALGREEGLVKVSGEVGTGKTMLARVLIARLPAHLRAIYLADPLMNRGELLAVLADELGCPPATGSDGSAHRLLRTVQEALVAEFAAGRQVVLLIDEAHAMPADTLEQIRLLSNLESERHKLIKIALFGQPELDDMLARADMRQLKDRITQHFRLDPLLPADVSTYLDFRLRAAGYRGPPLFEAPATARIARESGGLTRRINVLADKALLSAYARGAHSVGDSDAMRAVVDTQVRSGPAPRGAAGRIALTFAVAAALVAGGFLLGRGSAAPPVTPAPSAPSPTPSSPPAAGPAPDPTQAPAPPPTITTATLSEPRHAEPTTDARPAGQVTTDDPLQALLATSRQWSGSAPGEHWFIQLMSAPAAQGGYVHNYLQRARRSLDPEQLRIYRTDAAGGPQIAVIYGDFPDQRSALQSLAGLPDWIAASRPLPRQVRSLRQP
jgi:type II secretory pathway predicted ATPase ExeA